MHTNYTTANQGCVSLSVTNTGKDHTPESGDVHKHKYRYTTNTKHDKKREGGSA